MKRYIAPLLALTCILAVAGCRQASEGEALAADGTSITDSPDHVDIASDDASKPAEAALADYPAAIMVDSTIYLLGHAMPIEIDESAILGYTASYTDTFPSQSGETNFSRELHMPYAQWEGGLAVLHRNEWHLCVPEEP